MSYKQDRMSLLSCLKVIKIIRRITFEKKVYMSMINFNSENLKIDWISFNIKGLVDPRKIANRLSNYFTPHITIDNKPETEFHGLRKSYKVAIHQYTGSKGYWVGTKIIFSGKNAHYFYRLLKTQNLDWNILKFENHTLSLGRVDLCFSRPNDWNDTTKSFDDFLVDSRSQIQNHTSTKYIKLQNFPNGKMLKVNRRNNSRHYRVYQKDETVRFELELKHRQAKLVQDYLFQNQLDMFEHHLVIQYFDYSGQILRSDYPFTDWILNFQRKYWGNPTFRPLMTSYLDSELIKNQDEEERFFHLLQFLSFVKSLKLNPYNDCQKYQIKNQLYFGLKFPLSQFVKFTGIKLSNHSDREKLLFYFSQLQKLDPIIKVFSNMAFRSYVCFPFIDCANPSGKSWIIEVLVVEELFCFSYPFQLPKSFLYSRSKNDLRLKVRLMKSLAVNNEKKILDLEDFFNTMNIRNDPLIQLKKNLIQLLNELVEKKIIQNKVVLILKSQKNKDHLIQNLTTSDITRRIKYIQFHEIHRKSVHNFEIIQP